MYELCDCGHFGGMSPVSSHVNRFQAGHGECNDCECKQFTWIRFCNDNGEEYTDSELKIELNKLRYRDKLINNNLKQEQGKL